MRHSQQAPHILFTSAHIFSFNCWPTCLSRFLAIERGAVYDSVSLEFLNGHIDPPPYHDLTTTAVLICMSNWGQDDASLDTSVPLRSPLLHCSTFPGFRYHWPLDEVFLLYRVHRHHLWDSNPRPFLRYHSSSHILLYITSVVDGKAPSNQKRPLALSVWHVILNLSKRETSSVTTHIARAYLSIFELVIRVFYVCNIRPLLSKPPSYDQISPSNLSVTGKTVLTSV